MALIVFKYSYEGVVSEGRGSDKVLVGCICNQVDEIVYCFVDLFGREVERARARQSIKLIILEHYLLLMVSSGKELA